MLYIFIILIRCSDYSGYSFADMCINRLLLRTIITVNIVKGGKSMHKHDSKRSNNKNIVEELSRNLSESAREPVPTDIDGAYTGTPISTEDDMPVQDADDL